MKAPTIKSDRGIYALPLICTIARFPVENRFDVLCEFAKYHVLLLDLNHD